MDAPKNGTANNFRQSCVLGADSYFDAQKTLGHWLPKLQDDYERGAPLRVYWILSRDFHLSRVFFDARQARHKVFFVNACASEAGPR